MAELKTRQNDASVGGFLNKIKDQQTCKDCFEILKIMKQATKAEPIGIKISLLPCVCGKTGSG